MKSRSKFFFNIFTLFALLTLLLGSALAVTPVHAAGFLVTKTADTADGICNADCSLREAITAANALAGADTITVPNGTYTLTIAGIGEDANASGDLDILQDLTINGGGATIIQAGTQGYLNSPNGIDRVFHVIGAISVSISDVTIANGNSAANNGGGILNNGTLTVANSTFSGNIGFYGGGISNNGGTLTVTNTTFSENFGNAGGGIHNGPGIVTVMNSTFSGNSAGSGGQGGGIYTFGGTVAVTNSTFSTNSANYGGGILNDGTLTLTNSTLSDNSVGTEGGGIYNISTLTVNNSILADSTGGIKDCYNDTGAVSGTHNLIELDGAGVNACGTTAPINSDPSLSALADNGGPTQTFALLPSSLALGAGDNTICDDNPGPNNLDQRGVTRPQNGACDIGAYESNAQPGPIFDVNITDESTDGFCDKFVAGITDCTLREAIDYTNLIAGADSITFADALGTASIYLAGDLPTITDSLTINGGDDITVDGNLNLHRPFTVSSSGVLALLNLTVANGFSSGVGGGLFNDGGQVTIIHSRFKSNSAGSDGGGIYNNSGSTLTITDSTFIDQYSNSGNGGGIYNNVATATITNSTFSNNYADLKGGGIDNLGTLTVTNSTFSGNQSPTSSNGGGIYNSDTLHLKNTLLANSVSSSDCYNDGGTIAVDSTHNLIETNGAGANACGTPFVAADPQLGTLIGSPEYFPLNPGSPAINNGDDTICANPPVSNTSQNEVARPGGAHCDIGSFEVVFKLFLPLILR